MSLRAALAPAVTLLALHILSGCAVATTERAIHPDVVVPDRRDARSRSLGLMPRAEAAVAPTHSEAMLVSDRQRKIGR